jgi:hypothetical protein
MDNGRLVHSLDALVVALCLDYPRERQAIEERSATKRVDTEYRYYCFKIYDAVAEVVGERLVDVFIREIGNRIGYAKSELYYYSEKHYKETKLRVKINIAKKLHLI